ncbi:MAG: hypothetical protein ABR516_00010 [Desulfuromonadaceae bacterium]
MTRFRGGVGSGMTLLVFLGILLGGVTPGHATDDVLRGYYTQLEIAHQGRTLKFGPFVGYYFKPVSGADTSQLKFRCYNTDQFYTDELPPEALLFKGEAHLTTLPEVHLIPNSGQRITPVFAAETPSAWQETRPQPQDEFRHFHSTYDYSGATYTGYWLRHKSVTDFVYNMGGRLSDDSPLYHQVSTQNPAAFPAIIEFDRGK